MHPPFYTPDTRVSYDIAHHIDTKPVVRRGAASILRLLPAPNWPPISPYLSDNVDSNEPRLPSGRPVHTRPTLQVVPAPRHHLRDVLGRFLIRVGQRMILENKPG